MKTDQFQSLDIPLNKLLAWNGNVRTGADGHHDAGTYAATKSSQLAAPLRVWLDCGRHREHLKLISLDHRASLF
jgi:hypothetical protein